MYIHKFLKVTPWVGIIALNVIIIFDLHLSWVRNILGSYYLFFIPGFYITCYTNISSNRWEKLIYSLSLSLSCLLIVGYIQNLTLPLLGVTKPLNSTFTLITVDAIFIVTSILFSSKKYNEVEITLPRLDFIKLFPLIMLIIVILGTTLLNNGYSSVLIALFFIGFILNIFFLILKHKEEDDLFIYSLWIYSSGLLFSQSLRSWHISGWDINLEYYVFQITKYSSRWDVNNFRDLYNLCISITILPTIISRILVIKDEYIFKLIYPFIFSFISIAVYGLYRKMFRADQTTMSVFYLISQPWFVQPLTALARQEIALLFFIMMLYVWFDYRISITTRYILFVVFGVCLIISHYSTSYIALSIFLFTKVISTSLAFFSNHFKSIKKFLSHTNASVHTISTKSVLILVLIAFIWNSQLKSSNNVITLLTNSFAQFEEFGYKEIVNSSIISSISSKKNNINSNQVLNKYQVSLMENHTNEVNKYSKKETDDFMFVSMVPDNYLVVDAIFYSPFIIRIFEYLKLVIKIFYVVGTVYLLIKGSKWLSHIEYWIIVLFSLLFFLFISFVPGIASHYNITRAYFQILMIDAFAIIVGGGLIMGFVRFKQKAMVIYLLIIIYAIYETGIVSKVIGGYYNLRLNNSGQEYNMFYTHESEVASASWLGRYKANNATIFADELANLRLISFGRIKNTNINLHPLTLYRDSYVYSSYENTILNRGIVYYGGNMINYFFPNVFLNANKNLIYSNSESKIYR